MYSYVYVIGNLCKYVLGICFNLIMFRTFVHSALLTYVLYHLPQSPEDDA